MNAFNKHLNVADRMLSRRDRWMHQSVLEDFRIAFIPIEVRDVDVFLKVVYKEALPL